MWKFLEDEVKMPISVYLCVKYVKENIGCFIQASIIRVSLKGSSRMLNGGWIISHILYSTGYKV